MGIDRVEAGDAELVLRIRAGDLEAYSELVARYRDRLGRYAVHMIGNREDAEEALQDAFVRAYRSLARCNDPARFGAWLYGILVNRCRTTGARASPRQKMFVHAEHALNGAAHADHAERVEWADVVGPALAKLSPACRAALLLKHAEGLEYGRLAELTGGGVSALKTCIYRA